MDEAVTSNPVIALSGFIAIIALLFLFITKFKWHVFLALLVPIVLFAVLPGINREVFIDAFETGFGDTVGGIAVVIVLGCMIAEALKHTGGAERITMSMVSFVGRRRMPLALTLAGFVIGLAIFSDVGYVVLNPLVHSAAVAAGTNMSVMATGLVVSMQLTHAMVPPTPGPLAAIAVVGADIGRVILFGTIATFIGALASYVYARVVGPFVESPPSEEFIGQSLLEADEESRAKMPSTVWAYAPILIPLLLIAGQSVASLSLPEEHFVNSVMTYLGWPVVALGIGVLLAYRNARAEEHREERTSNWVEEALRVSAMIIVVTGLGGSLSEILQATPTVDQIAQAVAASGVPVIFLPFVLGIIGNMITGSTTVGVIAGASLSAPLMAQTGLSPEAVVLAAAAGSVIIKYMNSSYFWVCTSLSRMPLRSALISYGGGTLVGGVFSMVAVFILWLFGLI
ncbi:GntP family permease [Rubrobacter taiwanensis]|jgi:GntP family gluconate:H+ symporter|uniref:GntP family permease n=1 Tax=Rubrobacter taiwanensis TaxID=185139 RepID=A0A4R1BQL2_9ACTN|nr:GntP family permease [Rubrobacter taiwanensis]TCJ19858.1 GntP family permease [Rubrobacter taiwanensis]